MSELRNYSRKGQGDKSVQGMCVCVVSLLRKSWYINQPTICQTVRWSYHQAVSLSLKFREKKSSTPEKILNPRPLKCQFPPENWSPALRPWTNPSRSASRPAARPSSCRFLSALWHPCQPELVRSFRWRSGRPDHDHDMSIAAPKGRRIKDGDREKN